MHQRLDVETDQGSRSAAGAHHLVPKVSSLESERAIHRVPIWTMSQGENELNRGNTNVLSDEKLAVEVGVGSCAGEEQPLERSGKPIGCTLPSQPPVSIADVHDQKRREKRVLRAVRIKDRARQRHRPARSDRRELRFNKPWSEFRRDDPGAHNTPVIVVFGVRFRGQRQAEQS